LHINDDDNVLRTSTALNGPIFGATMRYQLREIDRARPALSIEKVLHEGIEVV
jgi:hypothetical protein